MLTFAAIRTEKGGRMKKTALALLLCVAATGALAHDPPAASPVPGPEPAATEVAPATAAPLADPAMAGLRPVWGRVKDILVRAAEKMPEEHYAFKPAPEVKTFGQMAAHVADAQYMMGGLILGEKPPAGEIEKTKTSKADIVAALKDSVAWLDKAFALGDADAAKTVKLFGTDAPKFSVYALAIGHGFEHYGNMVTYMRMKGLVPPSSEP
jgi:uncharacterized damage-inducible protein DinB